MLLVLAAAGTHDLVRYYPEGATVATTQAAEAGLLFWPHLLYNTVLVWVATALLVVTLSRMSGLYRRQSVLLVVAILLPILLNLLFNLRVGPFRQVDLTPFAFVLTTAVLVWGVYQFSLLDLRPVARSQIFRTISDPVLVLDPDGRVLDANPAAGRLVDRPPAEVVGQPVAELLPTWSATVTAALAAGVDQASEEVTRDGRIYDLAISALPDRQRQPGGHLVVARDVTERRQVEERLCAALNHERVATDRLAVALDRERAAAEHLRTLDELKSGFLQAVSHDLRTPLASVLGIALTLQRGRGRLGPEDTDDLLGRLAANARRLDRILTGLLDLDKLDRGIVELRREPVDLASLVAGVVSEAREELTAHPVSLDLLPIQVVADAAKVERIVENLLANAARHTDPGTPIWVRVEPRDRWALLCVDDAGPGIPAEQRESIFQPFQRGPGGPPTPPGPGSGWPWSPRSPASTTARPGSRTAPAAAPRSGSCSPARTAAPSTGWIAPRRPCRMRAVLSYLSRLVGVVRTVSGNPGLLRVELAYVGFNVAEWATWVSILAFAYQVGGAAATGLVALVS